uniref:Uncharacterized protein n=1 Tax=Oryza brachyantha TaxID=4533 RepID=J3LBY7_ORYBR
MTLGGSREIPAGGNLAPLAWGRKEWPAADDAAASVFHPRTLSSGSPRGAFSPDQYHDPRTFSSGSPRGAFSPDQEHDLSLAWQAAGGDDALLQSPLGLSVGGWPRD